ncbi:MAG: hypothetical protein NTZ05_05155 [Chloroflexi bacterium]|nr:hypothetical protein [Chloroflexota bacterium]
MAHTATADGGLWNSGVVAPGQSFGYVFTPLGTFTYRSTRPGDGAPAGTITAPAPPPASNPTERGRPHCDGA